MRAEWQKEVERIMLREEVAELKERIRKMAIRKCPKCQDPNFDDGACGCGWCKKCKWRQTCTQGGWYAPDFDKGIPFGELLMNDDPFPFGPINDGQPVVNVPSVFGPVGPSTLELAKAIRDCLRATKGGVPTGPLDELIAKYDFEITIKTTSTENDAEDALALLNEFRQQAKSDNWLRKERLINLLARVEEFLDTKDEALMKRVEEKTNKPRDFSRRVNRDEKELHEETGFGD